MNKKHYYIIGLLILGVILLLMFMQTTKNTETSERENNLEIYDAIDSSIGEFLNSKLTLTLFQFIQSTEYHPQTTS